MNKAEVVPHQGSLMFSSTCGSFLGGMGQWDDEDQE